MGTGKTVERLTQLQQSFPLHRSMKSYDIRGNIERHFALDDILSGPDDPVLDEQHHARDCLCEARTN